MARKHGRPTTADVARTANVSVATVSYVLNNVEGQRISQATRSAVLAAAEGASILQIHLGSPHLQVLADLNRTVACAPD